MRHSVLYLSLVRLNKTEPFNPAFYYYDFDQALKMFPPTVTKKVLMTLYLQELTQTSRANFAMVEFIKGYPYCFQFRFVFCLYLLELLDMNNSVNPFE